MIHIELASQFKVVANGTILAGMIYGTYIQTVGPRLKLYVIMYRINITKTIQNITGNSFMNMNNTPTIMLIMARVKLPETKIVFLPNDFKTKNEQKVNKN